MFPERVGVLPLDLDLLHERELALVVGLDKLLDLLRLPRLLLPKVVAGEGEYLETVLLTQVQIDDSSDHGLIAAVQLIFLLSLITS